MHYTAALSASTDAPLFLSARFHLRFLPVLVWRRIGLRAEVPRPFASHGSLLYIVTWMGATLAIAGGLPGALHGSTMGSVAAGLGGVALTRLLAVSVAGARDAYAGYASFRACSHCSTGLLASSSGTPRALLPG
jgi:hypothetical protein